MTYPVPPMWRVAPETIRVPAETRAKPFQMPIWGRRSAGPVFVSEPFLGCPNDHTAVFTLFAVADLSPNLVLRGKCVLFNSANRYRSSIPFALVASFMFWAMSAPAQSGSVARQAGVSSHLILPLTLHQTQYRMHAGESVPIVGPSETLNFVRRAKGRHAATGREPRERGLP